MATYTIGAYVLNPSKPFKTVDEAVKFVQERYSELSREVIEKYINPKIESNEPDRSGGIHKETKEGRKTDSKISKGGSGSEGNFRRSIRITFCKVERVRAD